VLRGFAPLGLLEATSPYADAAPELARALRDGLAAGRERPEAAIANAGPADVTRGYEPPPIVRRL